MAKENSETDSLGELLMTIRNEVKHYFLNRPRDKKYLLKDIFMRNIRDPNSVSYRLATALNIIEQIDSTMGELIHESSDTFSHESIKLLSVIFTTIQAIGEDTSTLTQTLNKNLDSLVSAILMHPKISEPNQTNILAMYQQHLNYSLANQLRNYRNERTNFLFVSPRIWGLRIADRFLPQTRDKRLADVNDLIRLIEQCKTADDYMNIYQIVTTKIKQITDFSSGLRNTLLNIQKNMETNINADKFTKFTTLQKERITLIKDGTYQQFTSPPKEEDIHNKQKANMDYFKAELAHRFTYRVLAHGVAASGILKRNPGQIEALGQQLAAINPGYGAQYAFRIVGGAIQRVGAQQTAQLDNAVSRGVPYRLIDNIAKRTAEKLAQRYAYQISQLYHTSLFHGALDKFIAQALDNMFENITSADKIRIPLESQQRYNDLILKENSNRISPAEQKLLDDLRIEYLAEQVVDGVNKNFTRSPLAGLLPHTQLMRETDSNSFFVAGGFNTTGIFEKPGYAVVAQNGSITFYTSEEMRPDKYGFVLISAEENNRLKLTSGCRITTKVDNKVESAYLNLYKQHQAQQFILPELPKPQEFANQIKDIYLEIKQFKIPLTDAQYLRLNALSEKLEQIKTKMNDALGSQTLSSLTVEVGLPNKKPVVINLKDFYKMVKEEVAKHNQTALSVDSSEKPSSLNHWNANPANNISHPTSRTLATRRNN